MHVREDNYKGKDHGDITQLHTPSNDQRKLGNCLIADNFNLTHRLSSWSTISFIGTLNDKKRMKK